MIRLVLLIALGFAVGCGKSAPECGPTVAAKSKAVKQTLEHEVLPLMGALCGKCHAGSGGVAFLVEHDGLYIDINGGPGVVEFEAPAKSSLLTKGKHKGPALTPAQAILVRRWIEGAAEVERMRRTCSTDDLRGASL